MPKKGPLLLFRGLRAAIWHDKDYNRELLEHYLLRLGMQVTAHASTEPLTQNIRFDLLFFDSDHNLPLENLNIDLPLIALVGSEAPSRLQSILANKAASMIFKPILAFPPAVRKIIYTTNATESLDGVIRKTTKTRGSFTTDDAATKLIYLAIRNFEKAGRCV